MVWNDLVLNPLSLHLTTINIETNYWCNSESNYMFSLFLYHKISNYISLLWLLYIFSDRYFICLKWLYSLEVPYNTHCIKFSDNKSLVLGEWDDNVIVFYRDGYFIKYLMYTGKCVGLVDSYTLGLTKFNEFDSNQIFYFNLEPIDN